MANNRLVVDRWQHGGFALYVHWPFCQSKCPYCDFNSHVAAHVDQEDWQHGYIAELRRLAAETPGRVLGSVFFGGGTPSLMNPSVVGSIIDEATRLWHPANDIEITLEANPTSVEANRFAGFRAAGVNRVSIGVQALNDDDLRKLGRMHDVQTAMAAVALGQKIFDRTSFDLIYARQNQTLGNWRKELDLALKMAGDHLSLYQLTIEQGTVFGERFAKGQLLGLPDEGLSVEMYEATQELCDVAGLPAYEVSNHARAGSFSRHNMVYWRGGDYLGVGPGAHGRITAPGNARLATKSISAPAAWLEQMTNHGHGELPRESLSVGEQANELLLMGLRLTQGLDLDLYVSVAGTEISPTRISELSEMGMVRKNGQFLQTTAAGRLVLNSVIRYLATVD